MKKKFPRWDLREYDGKMQQWSKQGMLLRL